MAFKYNNFTEKEGEQPMRFSSLPFLFGFLPITLTVYFAVPTRWRNLVLLLTSLVFYGWGEPVYISIMVLSILIDYTHGLLVEKYRSRDKLARWFVAESVLLNLGLLGFFKYWDFFAANLSLIPGISIPTLGLPLPIGISFFTFQTMSYTVDVYRQDAPAQRNMVSFGAYVTMFPQLVAGPIVRYKDVAAELAKPGRDVRDDLPAPILRTDVLEIKDLAPGMVLTGTVRNVVDFGVFVDIGVHQDGLVHISQVCNKFIRHPSEVVSVGDVVKVTVLEVDEKKHRISLSMKQAPKQ